MNTGLIIVLVLILIFGGYLGYGIYKYKKILKDFEKHQHNPNIITLTDNNFNKIIRQGITLVDFWAAWCKPCYVLAPVISQLADEYKGKVKVAKMDVEANRKVPNKLRIMNIPTVIIFKNGKEVERIVGVRPINYYRKALQKLL